MRRFISDILLKDIYTAIEKKSSHVLGAIERTALFHRNQMHIIY